MTFLSHLECTRCQAKYDRRKLQNLCTCSSPLFARYDLERLRKRVSRRQIRERQGGMWRFRELLPLGSEKNIISGGEGNTPLLEANILARVLGIGKLWIKDESFNPTFSFKARGMSAAVSKAKELGVRKICLPSAGNAGSAAAFYAQSAGMQANVFFPRKIESHYLQECKDYGAKVFVKGESIREAAQWMQKMKEADWFDISTLKEPYRVEGKKTLGLELAEELGWCLPDMVIYPTGGGTGLIGMWKAFEELEELGWIGSDRPRMVVVQASGCAPIVKAFRQGKERAIEWTKPHTIASGIKVPRALGDFLILKTLQESNGSALTVADGEIRSAFRLAMRKQGIALCPEGAAALAGLRKLLSQETMGSLRHRSVVIFNTGSALLNKSFLRQTLS